MSGGSFDYLYCKELVQHRNLVAEMLETIQDLYRDGIGYKAVEDTKEILALMDDINRLQEKLYNVWHAVEWYQSCDYGILQAFEALVEYEKKRRKEIEG